MLHAERSGFLLALAVSANWASNELVKHGQAHVNLLDN